MRRVTILLAALLLVLAAAVPAAAADPSRPLKGSWVGPDVFDFGATGCPSGALLRFHNDGQGQLTHLGRTAVSMDHCTYVEVAPLPVAGWVDAGTATLTAANRDTLVLGYTATFTMTPGPGGPSLYVSAAAQFEWTVLDGTGRFDGATGHGTASSYADMIAGYQTFWLTGTIAY